MEGVKTITGTQTLTPAAEKAVQKKEGDQAMVPLFYQPKLTIGSPDDPLEKEADDMADKVMRMEMPSPINFSSAKNSVNRKCAQCEEEEKQVQRKESNSDPGSVAPSIVHDVINSSGGRSLDTGTRSFMESRFNYDFTNVKIHDGDLAAKSAGSINALAYTSGNNVVFNSGQYNTNSDSGKRLLAHELTHVVQQDIGRKSNSTQNQEIQLARLPCTSGREVNIFLVSLPGATRNPQTDVDYANSVLCQCGIHLNVTGGQSWQTTLLDSMAPPGVLNESTSHNTELDTLLNYQPGGADVLHVYFVPSNTYGDRGGSYGYPGVLTGVPLSVSVTNIAVQDTLAHEIAHVLKRDGGHHPNRDNLLADGRNRNVGVDELEQTQCNSM